MTITLRPYQQELADSVRDAWKRGARNVLMHLGTGGGKTAILGSIVEAHEGASCVIAHRSELVSQVSQSLAQYGVMHDVICSTAVRRVIAAVHVQRFGKCFLRPGAMCRVASVDTLIRRSGLESWASTVSLWVVDECFPAGTLVDGRPIETIQAGDIVTAFNEKTGGFEPRKVVRLFKNVAPDYMVSIDFGGHHVINCTAGHPFWTRRGWVAALDLRPTDEVLLHDDSLHELQNRNPLSQPLTDEPASESRESILPTVLRVRSPGTEPEASGRAFGNDDLQHVPSPLPSDRGTSQPIPQDGAPILQQSVLGRIPAQDFLGNDGANQSPARIGTDDNEQPDVKTGGSGKSQRLAQSKGTQAEDSRRERKAVAGSRVDVGLSVLGPRLHGAVRGSNEDAARERLPDVLQAGLREHGLEAGTRSGRGFSYDGEQKSAGREKGQLSRWARVDRVTLFERGDNERPGRHCDDGYVYNIEVEGLHTYIADGVVVHNCHHLVQDNKWHRAIEMFTHPAVRGLGPTATPVRADGKGLGRHADGVIDEMVAGPPPRWLIEEGWLSDYDVICPTSDLEMLTNVAASGDWSQKALKDAAKRSHIVGDVVGSYLQHARGRLGVTFATDVETATAMAGAYREAGVPSEVLTGETDDRLRASILQRFERREVMQLCVVDIVSEGFDLPSIEVLSMARPTQSLGLYCLDPDTEILTSHGWAKADAVGADCVAFDLESGETRIVPILEKIKRPRLPGERMFGVSSPQLDICVSDKHDMVVRARSATTKNWSKQTAESLASRKSMFRVPVAGFGRFPGSGLTSSELEFLGWFLSDGTRNKINNAVMIGQAGNKHAHLESIRRALRGCNFRFGEHSVKDYQSGRFANAKPFINFSISKGAPRRLTDRHMRGWGDLEKWVDKSIPPCYDSLTRDEFIQMLVTLNLGDGSNQHRPKDWTPRSMHIACGLNQQMADRLQALAVQRGFRAQVSKTSHEKPQYILRLKDVTTCCVPGVNDPDGSVGGKKPYKRSRFTERDERPDWVWCVRNELGTIITRRNGKVAIVGNCQQFGRGLRPVYAPGYDLTTRQGRIAAQEASGKGRRMLLIDHVGNFIRHQGGPDAPRVWSLDRREKRAAAPSDAQALRVCIECLKPFKRVLTACPHCGAEIPAPAGRAGPEQVDGDLALLSPEVLAALRAELPEDEASYRERLMASRLPEIPLRANMKRHGERLEALRLLRHEIAVWSGALHAEGLSDREINKSFYLMFGLTTIEALSLSRADAIALTARVKEANDGA